MINVILLQKANKGHLSISPVTYSDTWIVPGQARPYSRYLDSPRPGPHGPTLAGGRARQPGLPLEPYSRPFLLKPYSRPFLRKFANLVVVACLYSTPESASRDSSLPRSCSGWSCRGACTGPHRVRAGTGRVRAGLRKVRAGTAQRTLHIPALLGLLLAPSPPGACLGPSVKDRVITDQPCGAANHPAHTHTHLYSYNQNCNQNHICIPINKSVPT